MKIRDTALGILEFDEDGVAEVVVSFNGGEVEVAVDLEGEPSKQQVTAASARAVKLAELDAASREAIRAELLNGDADSASVLYRSHHLQELDQITLKRVFGAGQAQAVTESTFINALRLLRVGVQPGSEDAGLSLDYSPGEDVTNYLLVVRFDAQGGVTCIDLES